MPWVCGHYKYLIVSAPEIDPRTERVKMPLGECLLFIEIPLSPVNMLNVGLALCQRRRRWTNVKPSLGKLLELLDMPCHGPETIISYSNKAVLFKCVIYTSRMVPKSESEEGLMFFFNQQQPNDRLHKLYNYCTKVFRKKHRYAKLRTILESSRLRLCFRSLTF